MDRTETLYSYLPDTNRDRFDGIVGHYTRWLLYRDGNYHDRLKNLFMKAMTPLAVDALRPRIEQRVNVLLDALENEGEFDAYREFGARIPVQVMADMLGLPIEDEGMLRYWSDRCSNFLFQPVNPDQVVLAEEQRQILKAQHDYLKPLIEERRARPKADLISSMVQAEFEGEKLTDMEILATCNMVMTAGGGTTRSAIAMGLWYLYRNPDQLAALRENPGLINLAAEEILRYDAPTQRGIRTALETFEHGGVTIEKGQILHLMLGAANRDPEQFADPDKFDISRNPNRHVTLGHGMHYCLGASLARMELRVALRDFINRFPNFRVLDDKLDFMDRTASRRPISMTVAIG